MRHSVIELAVLYHEWRHVPSEVLDPREKLLWVVDGLGDLLQGLNQADDVGATYLCDLHQSEAIDSAQSIAHDSHADGGLAAVAPSPCIRFDRE